MGRQPARHRAPLDDRTPRPCRQGACGDVMPQVTLKKLNDGTRADFLAALGAIFEHSPWVAEAAADARPFATLAELYDRLSDGLLRANEAHQIAVIRAHPDLAGKAARAGTLTK